MKQYLLWVMLLMSSGVVAANANTIDQVFKPYDELLKRHVKQGEKQGIKTMLVDYKAWSSSIAHKQALQNVIQFNPEDLQGKEKLVFWINTYNLLTIDLIITQNEKESIKNLGNFIFSPWKKFDWIIAGKKYTLDQIEHEILRPIGDPRIHVAINCASLSCPDLRPEAYNVDLLDSQLNDQVKSFLDNPTKGLAVNGDDIKLSKIFKWFAGDFEKMGGVVAFVKQYQDITLSNFDYLEYNWMLNDAADNRL